MTTLFNEELKITVDVKKSVARTSEKGLVQEIPCTFLIPKDEAFSYFDLAPLNELLETAEKYRLSRVSVQGTLPDQVRGPYHVEAWDYYEKPEEQEQVFAGNPLVFNGVMLGSIRLSQHKKEKGTLKVDTSLIVPMTTAELAGEIDRCAGSKLVVVMTLVQQETAEEDTGEPEEEPAE